MKRREKKVNKKRCQHLQKITTTELKRETEMNSLEKLGKTERTERERKKRGRKKRIDQSTNALERKGKPKRTNYRCSTS